MKPRKQHGKVNPVIWTKVNGRLVGEQWVTCTVFASRINRPYQLVLEWMRLGWLPAMEFGTKNRWTCLTPLRRSVLIYRELLASGKIRRPKKPRK